MEERRRRQDAGREEADKVGEDQNRHPLGDAGVFVLPNVNYR